MRRSAGRLGLALGMYLAVMLTPAAGLANGGASETAGAALVPIQIISPRPIELREYKLSGGPEPPIQIPATREPGASWQIQVRASSVLGLSGPGLTPHRFRLDEPGPTRVQVFPGRGRPFDAGLGLLIGGLLSFSVGVITGILSGVNQSPEPVVGPPGWLPPGAQLSITAGVTLTVGALGLITGGVLYGTSATQVVQTPFLRLAQPGPAPTPGAPSPVLPASAPPAP